MCKVVFCEGGRGGGGNCVSRLSPQGLFLRGASSVTAKGACGNVSKELFGLISVALQPCALRPGVLQRVQGSIQRSRLAGGGGGGSGWVLRGLPIQIRFSSRQNFVGGGWVSGPKDPPPPPHPK